jgi:hypothetical protein
MPVYTFDVSESGTHGPDQAQVNKHGDLPDALNSVLTAVSSDKELVAGEEDLILRAAEVDLFQLRML